MIITPIYLECPGCGDHGAVSGFGGCFYDGQPLICGCKGHVSIDDAGDEAEAFVSLAEDE